MIDYELNQVAEYLNEKGCTQKKKGDKVNIKGVEYTVIEVANDNRGSALKLKDNEGKIKRMYADELKENVNEAQNPFTDKVIKDLEDMTDRNDHTGRVIKIAQVIKDKKAEKALQALDVIHMYFGHTPQGLIDIRRELDNNIEKQIGKKYGNEILQKVHMTG